MASLPPSVPGGSRAILLSASPAASLPVCELLPLVKVLRVENGSDVPFAADGVRISSSPAFFRTFSFQFAAPGPRESWEASPEEVEPPYDWEALAAVASVVKAEITVELTSGGAPIARATAQTELLPPWVWPGVGNGLEESLAYFAAEGRAEAFAEAALAAGQASRDPRSLAPVLWRAVCRRGLKLSGWTGAADTPHPGERRRILTPEAFIGRGEGTALDMAVLFASLYLQAGLSPALVVTGRKLYLCQKPLAGPAAAPAAPWTPGRGALIASAVLGYAVCFDPAAAFSPEAAEEFGQEFSRSSAALQNASIVGTLDFGAALAARERVRPGPPGPRPQVVYPAPHAPASPAARLPFAPSPQHPGSASAPSAGSAPDPARPSAAVSLQKPDTPERGEPVAPDKPDRSDQTPSPAGPSADPSPAGPSAAPSSVGPSAEKAPRKAYDPAKAAPTVKPPETIPRSQEFEFAPGSESVPKGESAPGSESVPKRGSAPEFGSDRDRGVPEEPHPGAEIEVSPEPQPAPERLSKFETWKRRLLDLSGRNSLLNFRAGQRMVDIVAADLPGLEDRLASGKKFDFAAGLDLVGQAPAMGDAEVSEALLGIASANRAKNVLVACHEAKDLDRRLLALFRQARTAMQEGGSNILFLAVGFLAWLDGRLERQAPLILVPVTLSRAGAGSRFRLEALGDEPRFNLTLVEKLRTEHSIGTLDPLSASLPRDARGLDVAAILDRAAEAVAGIRGCRVTQRVTLGLFSFAKHLMWRDLCDIEAAGRDRASEVLNLLINRVPLADTRPHLGPGDLDDALRPADEYLPLRADSSQLAAVMRAAEGGSFVLIGPPGTGKSQTIANMIAQCVARGMTVLFVAEKAAALNVVRRRLHSLGLGGFCLELHSNRTDKLAVVNKLHQEAFSPPEAPWRDWALRADALEKARGALNAYARGVHRARPCGLTPFAAAGGLLTHRLSPDVELGGPATGAGVLALSREDLDAMLETAARLGSLFRSTRGKGSLMRYLGRAGWTPEWEEALCASARELLRLRGELAVFEGELGALKDPGLARTPLRLANALLALARLLPEARGGALRFVTEGPQSATRARLAAALSLLDGVTAGMRAFDSDPGMDLLALYRLFEALAGVAPGLGAMIPGLDAHRLDPGQEVRAFMADAVDAVDAGDARPDLARVAWKIAMTPRAGQIAREIPKALELLRDSRAANASLETSYYADRSRALDHEDLARLWDSAQGAFFVKAFLIRRKVRRKLASAVAPGAVKPPDPRAELDRLAALRRAEDALDALPALNALYREGDQAAFCGRNTSPRKLAAFGDLLARHVSVKPAFLGAFRTLDDAQARLRKFLRTADALAAVLRDWPSWGEWGGRAIKAVDLMLDGKTPFGPPGGLGAGQAVGAGGAGQAVGAGAAGQAGGAGDADQADGAGDADQADGAGDVGQAGGAGDVGQADGADQSGQAAQTAADAAWAARVTEASATVARFAEEAGRFMGLMGWRGDVGELEFGEAEMAARDVIGYRDSLNACASYVALRHEGAALGLGPFADALERGAVREGGERSAVWRSICARLVLRAVGEDPKALAMTSADRSYHLDLLRRSYEAKLAGAAGHVRGLRRVPGLADGFPKKERDLLDKEHRKKRMHLPVRRLLASLPELVPAVTPCLMMSPQSVAQYLPADSRPFDLVIFDEASQIPSADAVGALARGRRAVIVGDPKQLPPTAFFDKRPDSADDDEDAQDEAPLESILDDCLAAGFPQVSLGWHYRSRSEGLISFSNGRYYGGNLVTFPSPDARRAVAFVKVEGIYHGGKGGSRTNPIEAEAVAADVISLLRSPESARDGFSVGVVTFNAPQQELIENILERERLADPSLERFFDERLDEPVIVKNLENIQGDERGHVYFSVGYGPESPGARTRLNFGPLNKPGGERRLNVAITRARLGVKVFASFTPDAVPDSVASKGLADLRDFMRYAVLGGARGEGAGAGTPPSDFAAYVAQGLRRRGWELDESLGESGFRLDVAVKDPADPTRYLAGIECDGKSFRDSATAVDREILRGEVLAGLGWTVIRVWSMEWWNASGTGDAEARLDALDAELKGLLRERRAREAAGS
ncbi:MAG: DUF4011 domain-containing protein [Deltaproteobacteria bacterium]|jgi:hypothetical protein|nr:DUF4011 domain-containing protein [Deltaproteobacteria bacterium]